jgi:hypothetical protein
MLQSGAFSTIFVSDPMGRRRKASTIPLPLLILYAAIQCFLEVLHVFGHWDAHACIPCAAMSGNDRKMVHSQMRKARTRMLYADCGFIVLSSIVVCQSSLVARRRSCCYQLPSRHRHLLVHRTPVAAEEVSPCPVDRELVGDTTVVAP